MKTKEMGKDEQKMGDWPLATWAFLTWETCHWLPIPSFLPFKAEQGHNQDSIISKHCKRMKQSDLNIFGFFFGKAKRIH